MEDSFDQDNRLRIKNRWLKYGTDHIKMLCETLGNRVQLEEKVRQIPLAEESDDFLDLRGLDFNQLELEQADLSRFELYYSTFVSVKFNSNNFSDAWMDDCIISGSVFINCNFSNALLSGSIIRDTVFEKCDFSNSNFIGAKFERVVFKSCVFKRTIMVLVDTTTIQFEDCNIEEINTKGFEENPHV
jgi:uncharacterized protein YjbI with pentapeptide repeats